jgi:hypothetical protein
MHDLDDRDREAVLLRYFLRQDLIAVGMALGLDENATRMRTSRALEKLRAFLGRRGAAVSNAELLTALADRAVQPAPAGLAAAISVSIASIGKGGRSVAGAGGSIRLGRPGICMLGVVVAATAILLVWQHFQIGKLKAERAALWQEAEQAGRLRAENERLSKLKQNSAELERLRKERIELARLRVEVERLRKAAAANTNIIKELQVARATADAAQAEAARIAAEAEAQRISVNTANALSILGLAARTYASENDGLMPTNSAMLRLHLEPEEMPGGLQIENFEFVPHARQIKETETDLILLRERTARQRPDGKWVRAYWLVDGSSVEQASNDGNFEAWERLHTANIPAAR